MFSKANKESSRQISTAEGEAFASQMNCLFFETSAMSSIGVMEALKLLVDKMVDTPELWIVPDAGGVRRNNRGNVALESREIRINKCSC